MIKEVQFKGQWHRPETGERYAGTLTFDPIRGPQLEIVGRFRSVFGPNIAALITGETSAGFITLLDTRHSNGQASHETGATLTIYQPTFILEGYAFTSVQDIVFRSVEFSLFNLLEWFDQKPITEKLELDSYSLDYKAPTEIPFVCYEGCAGKIEFTAGRELVHDWYDIRVTQSCKVRLQYDKKRSFEDIRKDVFVFVRLLSLVTYEQSYPLSIDLMDEDIADEFIVEHLKKRVLKKIHCYYRNTFYRPEYQLRGWHQHLVRYQKIESLFPSIIHGWFARRDHWEQPIELLVRSFINKYEFSVEKFMDMAKGLELFHRLNFANEVLSKEKFEARREKICSFDLSREERVWIQEKLQYANEPNLKRRLEELLTKYSFSYLNQREPNKKKFAREAANCRNYYTHFNPDLKDRALKGKELFDLSENLKLLLIAVILGSIGVPIEAIEETVPMLIY